MGQYMPQNALNSPAVALSLPKGVNIAPQQRSLNVGRKNAWFEFCELNDVFPRYRNTSIEKLSIPPNEDGESFNSKALRYLDNMSSLILMGKAGRGKTHFMFALLREMFLTKNLPLGDVRYFDHVDLDRRLQEAVVKYKTARGLIESICEVPILILDDFGVDTGTTRHERDFYEIFNKRFGKGLITIISTNMDELAIYKAYGERISSRFKEALVLEFNGPDLRG